MSVYTDCKLFIMHDFCLPKSELVISTRRPNDCVLVTSYTIMDIPVSLQVPGNKANS